MNYVVNLHNKHGFMHCMYFQYQRQGSKETRGYYGCATGAWGTNDVKNVMKKL